MDLIEQLKQFALDNYEIGGHWIVECWDSADYNNVLDQCDGDVEAARRVMQRDWEFTNERARECAF